MTKYARTEGVAALFTLSVNSLVQLQSQLRSDSSRRARGSSFEALDSVTSLQARSPALRCSIGEICQGYER